MSNLSVKHNCSFSPARLRRTSRRECPFLELAKATRARFALQQRHRVSIQAGSHLRLHRESWIKRYNYELFGQRSLDVIKLQNRPPWVKLKFFNGIVYLCLLGDWSTVALNSVRAIM